MKYLYRILIGLMLLLVSHDTGMTVSATSDARPTYPVRAMTVGQSLMDLVTYSDGARGLSEALIAYSVTPKLTGGINLIRRAVGGSFACLENDENGDTSNYWAQYNGGSPIAGPLLTNAINDIVARLALGIEPTLFVFDQGQADSAAASGLVTGVTASQGQLMYDVCSKFVFSSLQTAMGAKGPIPLYIMLLGRTTSTGTMVGYEALRKLQLAWIAGGVPNTVRVPDSYDLGVYGGPHPDRSYVGEYGRHFGMAIANTQFAGAAPVGPTITGLSKPTTDTVEVSIAAEAGDTVTLPTGEPWGFDFYDGTTLLAKTWEGWHSGNPRWTLPGPTTALKGSYISGNGSSIVLDDAKKVIRGTNSTLPLQMKYF
jgi:hypothetical protein